MGWWGGVFLSLSRPIAGDCTSQRLGLSLMLTFHVGWLEGAEAVYGGEFSTDSFFYEPF